MRKYLKATYRAALRCFKHDDFTAADAADKHNTAVLSEIFSDIISGKISHAYIRKNSRLYVLTKSLYYADNVQMTLFREEKAQYHENCDTVDKLYSSLPCGNYINICA